MADTEADAPNHSEVLLGDQGEHPKVLLQKLQAFYCDKSMCDVTLKAGSYSVPAHKVVLAANSDYFTAMFTGSWAEKDASDITLCGVTPAGLKAVIEFAYFAKITVDPGNIVEILSAVHHCQLVKAYTLCEDYLKKTINRSNFIDLKMLVDSFNLADLENEWVKFAWNNLLPTYFEDDHSLLDGLETNALQQILAKWDFQKNGLGQLAAFDLVYKWARKNNRGTDLRDLLMAVNRNNSVLKEIMKYCEQTTQERKCKGTSASNQHLISFSSNFFSGIGWMYDVIAYNLEDKSWKQLPVCPGFLSTIRSFGVTVLDDILYLCGGRNEPDCGKPSNICYKYEPWIDRWVTIEPMLYAPTNFPLIPFEDKLYVLGGLFDYKPRSDVMVYDVTADKWAYDVHLPKETYAHAAAVCNGKIYISGGRQEEIGCGGRAVADLFCYDPCTKLWEEKSSMLCARFEHQLVAMGQHLYQCGGKNVEEYTDEDGEDIDVPADDPSFECYDVTTDTWTAFVFDNLLSCTGISGMNVYGMCPLNCSLYLFTGFDQSSAVFKFDPITKSVGVRFTCMVDLKSIEASSMLGPLNIPQFLSKQLPTFMSEKYIYYR